MQAAIKEINLNNILHNVKELKRASKAKKFCAVVKADAYGHGAEEVSLFIEEETDCFAVSLTSEGVALRSVGITKDILVLTPPLSEEDAFNAVGHSLIMTVADDSSLSLAKGASGTDGARVHIKINTGMNRYGFSPRAFTKILAEKESFGRLRVEGIYSHFFDSADTEADEMQFRRFLDASKKAEKVFCRPLIKHISSTGGLFKDEKYHLDMVRVGLGIYGYAPFPEEKAALRPAMKCYAPVSAREEYLPYGCGYGRGSEGDYATVRFGYADGLMKNSSLGVNGLCMDAFVTDQSIEGDQFLVFDDAQKEADRLHTIPYEILCSFSERVEKRYVYE